MYIVSIEHYKMLLDTSTHIECFYHLKKTHMQLNIDQLSQLLHKFCKISSQLMWLTTIGTNDHKMPLQARDGPSSAHLSLSDTFMVPKHPKVLKISSAQKHPGSSPCSRTQECRACPYLETREIRDFLPRLMTASGNGKQVFRTETSSLRVTSSQTSIQTTCA
jgi:hypothetical protein